MTNEAPRPEKFSDTLRQAALDYHALPSPGKLAVVPTKPLGNARELALAYSPGVAAPCEAIMANPLDAFRYGLRTLREVIRESDIFLGLSSAGLLKADMVASMNPGIPRAS